MKKSMCIRKHSTIVASLKVLNDKCSHEAAVVLVSATKLNAAQEMKQVWNFKVKTVDTNNFRLPLIFDAYVVRNKNPQYAFISVVILDC